MNFAVRSRAISVRLQGTSIARTLAENLRRWCVHAGIRHVCGPRKVALAPSDVVAVCLVRNGAAHVESFLKRHFALGVRHVVLLDNGSDDLTIRLAREFDRITILQTFLPYGNYKYALKRYLFDQFAGNGWCLMLDVDERFDFPMSDRISLADFVAYLNQEGYTAVVAQMLDLFANGALATWPIGGPGLTTQCRWYDNSGLIKRPYKRVLDNQIANPAIQLYGGGIRKSAFGVDVNLSKHPLLYRAAGARPSLYNSHDCHNAKVADISCVLLHYKFDRHFREKCVSAVRSESYYRSSQEYKAYLSRLEREPNLTLKRRTADELQGLDQLIEKGFLIVSEAYRDFVRTVLGRRVSVV